MASISRFDNALKQETDKINSFLNSNSCLLLPEVLVHLVSEYAPDRIIEKMKLEKKINSLIIKINKNLQKLDHITNYNETHSKKLILPEFQENMKSDFNKLNTLIDKYILFTNINQDLIEEMHELNEIHNELLKI